MTPQQGFCVSFSIGELLGRVASFWRQLDHAVIMELFSLASSLQEGERLEVWAGLHEDTLQLCFCGVSLQGSAQESLSRVMTAQGGTARGVESVPAADTLQPFWGATRGEIFRCVLPGGALGTTVLRLSEEGGSLHYQEQLPSPAVLSEFLESVAGVTLQIAEQTSDVVFNEEGDRVLGESRASSEKIPLPPPLPHEGETVLLPEALLAEEAASVGDELPTRMLGDELPTKLLGDEPPTRILDGELAAQGDELPTRIFDEEKVSEMLPEDMATPVEVDVFDDQTAFSASPVSLSDAIHVQSSAEESALAQSTEDETPSETVSLSDAILIARLPTEEAPISLSLSDAVVIESLSSTQFEEVDARTPVESSSVDLQEVLALAALSTWSDENIQFVLSHAPTWSSCEALAGSLGQSAETIARIFSLASGAARHPEEEALGASVERVARACGWVLL